MTTHDDRVEMDVRRDDMHSDFDTQGNVDVQNGDDRDLLFGPDAAASFEHRWGGLQAMFVDDPRGAVQAADALVMEVTEALTAEFASHRSELESEWSQGSSADTEKLRVALRRYRAFFQRLLSA
ncbi:MAG TPA: hypothetical protein VFJ17_12065 [Mycobacteriales bacterium]|jgi:hypothetical protein|nr:hypothetical protein [Mycobacteriales bacterium]